MHAVRETSLIALSLCFIACSGEPGNDPKVNIGDRHVGVAGDELTDFSGEWEGYMEAFSFSPVDGSDRIRISLDSEGQGAVRFGERDEPYPLSPDPLANYPVPGWTATSTPLSGFAYPMHDAALDDGRFRFRVQFEAAYDGWCALHAPTQSYREEYQVKHACVGGVRNAESLRWECFVVDAATSEHLSIGCGDPVESQCNECACDAEACRVAPRSPARFDGRLEDGGNRFVATMLVPTNSGVDTRVTVRLTRVSQ